MIQRIRHRGPDDSGVWCDDRAGIMLAHARLSIVDLSPAGHQPMQSACGKGDVERSNGDVEGAEWAAGNVDFLTGSM